MKLLELNHVEKSFDGLGVIKDMSLSVEEGEIVSVIGPSGSGKSTLLRCATMLETMESIFDIYSECAPVVGKVMLEAMAAINPETMNCRCGENIIEMPKAVQNRLDM